MMPCDHSSFRADVSVFRLSRDEGGPVTGYTADVRVSCNSCGLPFRFVGLPAGTHYAEPRVSIDGTELRAPLEPAVHEKFQPLGCYTLAPRSDH